MILLKDVVLPELRISDIGYGEKKDGLNLCKILRTSWVLRPSMCGYLSMMHIRNRLLHGFSYVRRSSRSGYLSMMHIRNRLLHEFSYVHGASRERLFVNDAHTKQTTSRVFVCAQEFPERLFINDAHTKQAPSRVFLCALPD